MTIERSDTFAPATLPDLAALAEQARTTDGAAPFSDHLWHAARHGESTSAWIGKTGDGQLSAAAVIARQGHRLAAELVVAPDQRRKGIGGRLLTELLSTTGGELWLWAHGDHPAARVLAARHDLRRARELLQLRRPVGHGAPSLPEIALPDGVCLRTFVVGQDEQAWLDVNNMAFSSHPEQGGQTLEDIRAAEAEDDFDPAGFFLAVDTDNRLLGFHWTKVHPRDPNPRPGSEPERIGEVYVLGVAPAAHGMGLGAALTVAGLRHLSSVRAVNTVTLYVEGDNAAALRLYERLGFARYATDIAYLRPADRPLS